MKNFTNFLFRSSDAEIFKKPSPDQQVAKKTWRSSSIQKPSNYFNVILNSSNYLQKQLMLSLLCMMFLCGTAFQLSAQQNILVRSDFQMNRGLGHIPLDAPITTHGAPILYTYANIPLNLDPDWEPAPVNSAGNIVFSESSSVPCFSAADFTYFQTFVNVPAGTTIFEFSVSFQAVDDGARAYVFNSIHPNGEYIVGGDIVLGGNPVTGDLSSLVAIGEINRIVIVQVDDCAIGNNLINAQINVNGAILSSTDDIDGDGILDADDNCPTVPNIDQADDDGDGNGNECDLCPGIVDVDGDGDGYVSCLDCDDTDATIYPGAPELCDGKDNDCDGNIPADEIDNDGDGYSACSGDCNDNNPSINPGEEEDLTNGVDDNCNGLIDEDLFLPPSNLIDNYPEAYCYKKVYEEDFVGGFPSATSYDVDFTNELANLNFNRVAYYLELEHPTYGSQWIWVSMDDFTEGDITKIGIPFGFLHDELVTNMDVASNVAGIVTGDSITTGNLEIWPGNYGTGTDGPATGGTNVYDFDDSGYNLSNGYGSFQIHNYGAGQTLIGINNFRNSNPSMGIGNAPNVHSDWTFANNGNQYSMKKLYVLISDGPCANCDDNDGDDICDEDDPDDDNDGIDDVDEIACGSDPLNDASTCEICDGIDNDLDGDTDEGFIDTDGDDIADCVDPDDDNDGVLDSDDSAPLDNLICQDLDGDGCDDCASGTADPSNDGPDADADGLCDSGDECPLDPDNDIDGDRVCGDVDNCPDDANNNQADADADGLGDVCDTCPNDADNDIDGDGVCGDVDNCPTTPNTDQADADCDGVGDVCDICDGGDDSVDNNGDGIPDCSQLLAMDDYSDDWKCGNENRKIKVCHVPPGNPANAHTICISYNALVAHYNNHEGDNVGPCSCEEEAGGGSRVIGDTEISDIQVFPNPAIDHVSLAFRAKKDKSVRIQLSDVYGNTLYYEKQDAAEGMNNIFLEVEHLRNGIYFILIEVGKENYSRRFVKMDTY